MNVVDSLSNAVSASVLTRFLANIFAFLLLLSALVVGVLELVNGQPINVYVATILGTGTGYALHVLGINQGVTLDAVKRPAQEEQSSYTTIPLPALLQQSEKGESSQSV